MFTGNDLKVTTLTGKQILLTESSSAIQSSLPLLVVFDRAIKILSLQKSSTHNMNKLINRFSVVITTMAQHQHDNIKA